MIISQLFTDLNRRSYAAVPEADALTEEHALQEAALVDVRFSVVESTAGLLFDLRTALGFRMANTGVIIVRRVFDLQWETSTIVPYPWVSYMVMGSFLQTNEGFFSLSVGLEPSAWLRLKAMSAEFFVGDVRDLPETQPDFGGDNDTIIRAGMANWDSQFEPEWATFLDEQRP